MEINSGIHFATNWRIWQMVGAVDLNRWNLRNFRFWVAAFCNAYSIAFSMTIIIGMFSFDNPLDNILNFTIVLTTVATVSKFFIFVKQLNRIRLIEQELAELDSQIDTDDQRKFFKQLSNELFYVTRLIIGAYVVIAITVSTTFLLRDPSRCLLPFPGWFPLDLKASRRNYLTGVGFQLIGIVVQLLENCVDDLFPPLVLCIISGHCQMLIMRASRIGHHEQNQCANEQQLIKCIEDQEKLYKLLQLAMAVISWPLMVQFILIAVDSGASLCALLYYVDSMQERLYYISFIFGLSLQVLPVCYYGTEIEHHFSRLHYAVFCSNWPDQSYIYRRNALIFAERTQRVRQLLAGNLIPIALTTFVTNAKTAYSFCTLIADTNTTK
ncbi:odorant receptor 23a-like [Drosophila busckii]|uniref:odorant receptor 23a-like n=1 Tax=Drosophila busckii TaxID=30019 RepID=UPI00083EC692|nr:odorant receptor 23a-like [Drosophila busckii]